jgi:hypothetical protein
MVMGGVGWGGEGMVIGWVQMGAEGMRMGVEGAVWCGEDG